MNLKTHEFVCDWEAGLLLVEIFGRGHLWRDKHGNRWRTLASHLTYRGQNKLADFAIVAEPCEAELHAEAHA